MIVSFSEKMSGYSATYSEDMMFLLHDVWPLVKNVAYCHDSFSCGTYTGAHPFPVKRQGTEHIGQVFDQLSVGRANDIGILKRIPVNVGCVTSSSSSTVNVH